MKITFHAAERFLQRVLDKKDYTKEEIFRAKAYLQALLHDVVVRSYSKQFALPNFESYLAVYQENALVTIIPKDKKEFRDKSKKYQYIESIYVS